MRYVDHAGVIYGPHSVYSECSPSTFLQARVCTWRLSSPLLRRRAAWRRAVLMQYAHMLAFSLVGSVVSGLFLGRAYFDCFFLIVACLVILKQVKERALEEATDAEEDEGEDLALRSGAPA